MDIAAIVAAEKYHLLPVFANNKVALRRLLELLRQCAIRNVEQSGTSLGLP